MARAVYNSRLSLTKYIYMHGSYPEHVIYLFTYNAFTLSPYLTLSAMHTITTVMYKPIIRYITTRHGTTHNLRSLEGRVILQFSFLDIPRVKLLWMVLNEETKLWYTEPLKFPFTQYTKTFKTLSHNRIFVNFMLRKSV